MWLKMKVINLMLIIINGLNLTKTNGKPASYLPEEKLQIGDNLFFRQANLVASDVLKTKDNCYIFLTCKM